MDQLDLFLKPFPGTTGRIRTCDQTATLTAKRGYSVTPEVDEVTIESSFARTWSPRSMITTIRDGERGSTGDSVCRKLIIRTKLNNGLHLNFSTIYSINGIIDLLLWCFAVW